MKKEALRLENITQIKRGVRVLDNLNLHIFQGEIMGLLCVDAHGREDLLEIISENVPIHYGRVYFEENLVNNYAYSHFSKNKVTIIGNRSKLVEDLTVADNIFVLRKGFKKYMISKHVLNQQVKRLFKELNICLEGKELVKGLTSYEKCLVELVKAFISGVKLVIIKDISNDVSTIDLMKYHTILRAYAKKGMSFLYVCSHHEEAFKICTRLSVFENGKIVKIIEPQSYTRENMKPYYKDIIKLRGNKHLHQSSDVILKFEDVCSTHLEHLSFEVQKGECIILLDTNNQIINELLKIMNGEIKPQSGRIYLEDKCYNARGADQAFEKGISFVNGQPTSTMIFKEMTYLDNFCFALNKKTQGILRWKAIQKSVIKEYESFVGKNVYKTNISELTQSDLYKLIYYRIHFAHPKIVFCVQPFFGADMYLRKEIIELIEELKKKSITVIILAVNISDSLMVGERMIVIDKGTVKKIYHYQEFYKLSEEATIFEV